MKPKKDKADKFISVGVYADTHEKLLAMKRATGKPIARLIRDMVLSSITE